MIPIDVNTTARWQSNGRVKLETSSGASSRGLIPKARIKTIKMTLVIVLGKLCLRFHINVFPGS